MNLYVPIVIMVTLIELFLVLHALCEWYFEAALDQFGRRLEARISICERKPLRWPYYEYNVKYRYDVDGVSYEIPQRISRRNFLRLPPGTFVIISYLPDHPNIARLAEKDSDTDQRNVFTIHALIFSILLVLVFIRFGSQG